MKTDIDTIQTTTNARAIGMAYLEEQVDVEVVGRIDHLDGEEVATLRIWSLDTFVQLGDTEVLNTCSHLGDTGATGGSCPF